MIKKIHYIWLGNNTKSRIIKRCIRSWRKFFPDWEIIEWNEANLSVNNNKYCFEAYKEKKYAFASDFLRLDVLYKYGGLYFDTDVEVIKDMRGLLKQDNLILGYENDFYINPGLVMYAPSPNNCFIKKLLDDYKGDIFLKSDGNYNNYTICERTTKFLRDYGFRMEGKYQSKNGITLFPREFFCPTNNIWSEQCFTENTYSIHHYAASWMNCKHRIINACKKYIYKTMGVQRIRKIRKIIHKGTVCTD